MSFYRIFLSHFSLESLATLRKAFGIWLENIFNVFTKSLARMNKLYKFQKFEKLEHKGTSEERSFQEQILNVKEEQFDHSTDDYPTIFDSYILEFEYQEAYQVVQNPKALLTIKPQQLIAFMDQLLESNNINLCFGFFEALMVNRPAVLTKNSIKKMLGIAVRNGHKLSCYKMISNLSSHENIRNQMDVYFRVNQYFINFLLKAGDYDLATEVFTNLKQSFAFEENENALFYYKIYEIMIKECLSKQINRVEEAKCLLNEIAIKKPNEIFFNKLISFSSKFCDISFAEYIFKVMVSSKIQPSIVTYNTLIDSYFKQNRANQAWMIFELLKQTDTIPDNFTYTTMINGLKSIANPDIEKAFVLFREYKQFNNPDHIIYNCLLDACINVKDLSRAHELFVEMKDDPSIKIDEITYNTLIKGCCRSKKLSQAIQYYHEMKRNSIHPNRITYNSLIDNCVKANKMKDAWQFYEEMIQAKIVPDNFTYSILVNGIKSNHTNKDDLNKALDLMNHVQSNPEFKPDEILYNSLIDTCVKFNEVSKAFSLFEEMKRKRIEPSPVTYGILIKAYGKANDLVKAFGVFEQMKNKNMKINEVAYGCLLDACVKNDRMDLALILFENMKKDNIAFNTVHYTTMIKGYSKSGKFEEALRTFYKMKENSKTQPNLITYNCMIDACVKVSNINLAIELLDDLLSPSMQLKPDLITFSTLIKGLCMRKDIETAYNYLGLMLNAGIKPDEALFNLVLESCYSNNCYELGLKVFDLMDQVRVQPSNVTFSIIIRLHSRANKLQKVIELLDVMRAHKIKPSLIIFTNIIQACFKANRIDKVLEIMAILERTKLKWDPIFYSKLISGFLNFNRLDFAIAYCERSLKDGIFLGQEIYNLVINSLQSSNLANKFEIIAKIENFLNYSTCSKHSETTHQQASDHQYNSIKKTKSSYHFNNHVEEEKENLNTNIPCGKNQIIKPSNQKKDYTYSARNNYSSITHNSNSYSNVAFYSQKTVPQAAGKNAPNDTMDTSLTTEKGIRFNQATKKPLRLGTKEFFLELK